MDLDEELKTQSSASDVERTFELPDGQVITVGTQRFRCPEPIFQPSLMGIQSISWHEAIYYTIQSSADQLESLESLRNVVLSGGNTLFHGLGVRLQKELERLFGWGVGVDVHEPESRKFLAWRGGCVYSVMPGAEWVSKMEYDETGPDVMTRSRQMP